MPSIRRKIGLGFYSLIGIIALLALFAYSDLAYLERRIGSGVAVYGFLDAVLELRLQEKNFFLYGDEDDLRSALDYAVRAQRILEESREAFLVLQGGEGLRTTRDLLRDYIQGLSAYRGVGVGEGQSTPAAKNAVRRMGGRLRGVAEALAAAERIELRTSVSRSQWALLISVVAIALVGTVAAQVLSRVSVRPLSWLEAELAAIGDGRYRRLEPVSGDREIVSVGRAVNRMLNDIETRNRHLLQAEKLVSLGTLASGVAHELNNPLANISASCQILLEELEPGPCAGSRRWLEQIDDETERARLIVRSVLEFSRENRVAMAEVDLRDVLHSSLVLIGQQDNPNIRMETIPAGTRLVADAQKLQQVFLNLFRNALDAGGGSVTVRVRSGVVAGRDFRLPEGAVAGRRFCASDPDACVLVVEVEDDGPGIPQEVLPRVFDPFFTTKGVGQGDGLGLYVAQEIVDIHGGCIGVASAPGAGTRFIVGLPCGQGCRAVVEG